MKTILTGIFLTAENVAVTAKFYREVAGLDLEQIGDGSSYTYYKLDNNGIQLAIHDASAFAVYTHPLRPESNVTHLYFKIASQAEFLAQLSKLGLTPNATDDVVITVTDPDGRKVMFGIA